MLPQVIDKVATEVRDPPQGDILRIVCKTDRGVEQCPCCLDRLGFARLKREIKIRQRPADRRVEDGRQSFIDIGLFTPQSLRDLLILVIVVVQPIANEVAQLAEIAQDQMLDRCFAG